MRQYVGNRCIIGVGDKMDAHVAPETLQGQCRHLRAEIGTADADMNQIGDALAGSAFVLAAQHLFCKRERRIQCLMQQGHHVFSAHIHRRGIGGQAQGGMQRGTLFAVIHQLTFAHGLQFLFDAGLFGQLAQ